MTDRERAAHIAAALVQLGHEIPDEDMYKGYIKGMRSFYSKEAITPQKPKTKIPEREYSDISSLPKKKTIPATPVEKPKKQSAEKHSCERKKRDGSDCPKNAIRSIEIGGNTHWYCGTEKSGCYKSVMEQQKKTQQQNITDLSTKTAKSKKKSNQQIDSLLDKLSTAAKNTLEFQKIKDPKLGMIHLNAKYRFVCNDNKVVIGKLSGDKIIDLTDEDIKILDNLKCSYIQKDETEDNKSLEVLGDGCEDDGETESS